MKTTFWDRLQELLRVHGKTQIDLCKDLDLSPSFLSTAIGRNSAPRADFALKVAKYFGMSLEWLISGEDEHAIDAKFAVVIKNDRIMEMAYKLTKCSVDFLSCLECFVDYEYTHQKTFGK